MANDYKPLASGVGANVESQAQFETDLGPGGVLQNGFQAGTAPSAKCNKVWRQSSVMTSALATAVINLIGGDLLDDGNVAALAAKIALAFTGAAWTTGDVKLTMKIVADPGWVMFNDGTIGDATSGATMASDANHALFVLLWNNVSNTWAPVVSGRGGSAEADWAAHKRLTLTKTLGRVLGISGAGVGLTARALGENLGVETVTLTQAQTPLKSHNHALTDPGHDHTGGESNQVNLIGGTNGAFVRLNIQTGSNTGGNTTGITIAPASDATATPHENMQPTTFMNAMIKQ